MRVKHDSLQMEMDLGLAMVRRAVLALRRFTKSILLEMPGAYAWGDYEESTVSGRKDGLRKAGAKCGGELCAVSYSDWLEFYTPLCSRGQNGGGL